MATASVFAAACTDVLSLVTSKPLSELAVLRLQSSTPAAAGAQFYVANSRVTTRTFSHLDPSVTLYLQLTFPTGSLATVSGSPAGASDSVLVTVQHVAGVYQLTLGTTPAATFSAANSPTARFSFATYGDFTTSRAGTQYATSAAYAQALTLWREETLDRYATVPGSGPSGSDGVAGTLAGPGSYLAAAPR